MTLYGYIRTSKDGAAGSDPETQRRQEVSATGGIGWRRVVRAPLPKPAKGRAAVAWQENRTARQ